MASVFPAQTCSVCENESAGKCPRCRNYVCMEHYPRHSHEPCAKHIAQRQEEYVCYICGEAVVPEQWSAAIFAHYIDNFSCAGCGRYVCEEHTRRRSEHIKIAQDTMRSHRYNIVERYCSVCSSVRIFGGLTGAVWWAAGIATVIITGWFLYHG